MKPVVIKEFPLPRIQCGAPLGNSFLGVLVWGGGKNINISFGSHSVWDHRGGLPWSSRINFADIRESLEQSDEKRLREIFAFPEYPEGTPKRPQIVPLGRLMLELADGSELQRYELDLENAGLKIIYELDGKEKCVEFLLGRSEQKRLMFRGNDIAAAKWISSWHLSKLERKYNSLTPPQHSLELGLLESCSFPEPEYFDSGSVQGFRQIMPADPDFALAFRRDGDIFTAAFARGDKEIDALKDLAPGSWDELAADNTAYWSKAYAEVTEIEVDNPILTEMYWFGIYKFISMSDPAGIPAGLQGPWIEDDRFPPWSADYHFNINVQMCYGPALRANLFKNLMPLFNMVRSWKDKLQQNAYHFVGVKDGILMPHAVDDRGTCMGGFWTGAIDHACSAWTAQMMFDYCDYSGDMEFLKSFVYDFMKGTFKVYAAMMTEDEKGALALPVTVSPEYRGARFDAWGVNASFQLAAVHRLIRNLSKAAEILGEAPDPQWADVGARLPRVTVVKGAVSEFLNPENLEIALWEGQPLEFSHRHHSHLAGICPFNTIDPEDPEFKELVFNTRQRWIVDGMGDWSGWSMAWAAQLNSHFKQAENAEMLLEIFNRLFTNKGGGTLHDATFSGFSLLGDWQRGEVMQIDGCMGAVSAIQEMMLFDCCGVLNIGYGVPERWRNASFKNMPAPGGFKISASFQKGRGTAMSVTASRKGTCRIKLDPDRCWPMPAKGVVKDDIWEITLEPGETVTL